MEIKTARFQGLTSEEIYYSIRRRIIRLELEPGKKLSENKMAQEYGVSRSIIHGVFIRLNQLGLVEVYPQRGTYVSKIDVKYVENLHVLRASIERDAMFEVFELLDSEKLWELIGKLEENLEKQEQFRDSLQYNPEFEKIDTEFHKLILDSADRYDMVQMVEDKMLHMYRWRYFDVKLANRVPELIDQHRAIVEAMKTGKFIKVLRAISHHLASVTVTKNRAMAKYPQYFK